MQCTDYGLGNDLSVTLTRMVVSRAQVARKDAERRAAEARKNRIQPRNPWKAHRGKAARLPKSVGLLDRIYRPVLNKQLERRAKEKDAEAQVPEEQRQWRWCRLNPGLDEFGWVRTDRPLQSSERCPICSAEDGHGAHRLHLERHTIKELQIHAKSIGVSPEVLRVTISHAGLAPEQTKQALVAVILEARKYKHELHSEWRKHTTALKATLAGTPYIHESALRRDLEALTLNVLVERAKLAAEALAATTPDEATSTASEKEPAELGQAHKLLIGRIVQLTPSGDDEKASMTPVERKEREDAMRLQLEGQTPTALWERAKELEVDGNTIQAARREEAELAKQIMDMQPVSLATHAGEAGAVAKEIAAAVEHAGEGYLYQVGEQEDGKASGPLVRTGYWSEPSSLMTLAEESGKGLGELRVCSESELRALIADTAAASADKSTDREELIVSEWAKQNEAREQLTKLVRSGSHKYDTPHPKHTELLLKQHLLAQHDHGQVRISADNSAVLHAQRLGSTTAQKVNTKTQKYHRRGGPQRNHPKYRKIAGKRRPSGKEFDGIPVEEMRKRAVARGIVESTLVGLRHQHRRSPEDEKEAILALLMEHPGQLSHLTAEQPKGVALVRRELMSMPIADLRERLLPVQESRLLNEEEQDLPADERRALTLERVAREEKKSNPEFIPVDSPEPDEEIDGAFGLPPTDVDYTRIANLKTSEVVPAAWDGREWPYGYVFKSGDRGLGFYQDPGARKEEVERAKLVREILGKPLTVGMDLSAADVGNLNNAPVSPPQEEEQKAPRGSNDVVECSGKAGCLNPAAGLHHKTCPCFNQDLLSGTTSGAGAPVAWLEKAVSNAAAAVASAARTGCDLPANQQHRHRWLPVGNSIPARADRRTGMQKLPTWDAVAISKGGRAAEIVDKKTGGVRHLIGPSIAFDEHGKHIDGNSEARLRKMLANRKKCGQPPARHDYWLDKHTFGIGSRAQLPPDPCQPICTNCGKQHNHGSLSCTERIHKVISREQHQAGSKPCLGKPRCLDAARGVHHRACPCIDIILEHEEDGVTATKAIAVEFAPQAHLPFDIQVPPDAACPFGAVITVCKTVHVGHAAALHIEGLHQKNAMQHNTRSRGNKGGRKMHSVPLGNGLTTESHSHRVIPGSELKPADSDSDDEDEAQDASEVHVAEGPNEHLVRWNEMMPEQRTSALRVLHMMSDSDGGESKSTRLAERLSGAWHNDLLCNLWLLHMHSNRSSFIFGKKRSGLQLKCVQSMWTGIMSAARQYSDAQVGRHKTPQGLQDGGSKSPTLVYDEEVAIRKSLQRSGVFSDLGRPELLNQWSGNEWEQFRAMRLDKHAAEGDMALLSGCVGMISVGHEELAALQRIASATVGIATASDAPAHIET